MERPQTTGKRIERTTLCISIHCAYCGATKSGHNKRGFSKFVANCVADGCDGDFIITESISAEVIE